MKTKYVLSIVALLAGGVVQTRADESLSARNFVGMNYPHVGVTMNEGIKLADKGDYEKACQYYTAAISQDPKAWPIYLNRGVALMNIGKLDLAIQDFNTLLRLAPGILMAQILRGQAHERLGNYSRALADYDRIVSIAPPTMPLTCALAHNNRAWLRATCPDASFRNGKQAVADAQNACNESSWREALYIDTLAAAHAEAGDFDSAVQFERRAIDKAREDTWAIKDQKRRRAAYENQVARYQHRLAAYERHQPWRSNVH